MTGRGWTGPATRARGGRVVAAAGGGLLLMAFTLAAVRLVVRPGASSRPAVPPGPPPASAIGPAPRTQLAGGQAGSPRLPGAGEAELRRGIAVLERGRLPAAAQTFERAVRRDPRAPLARDYLGIAYLRMRRYADALRQFREEIAIRKALQLLVAEAKSIPSEQARAREKLWTPEKHGAEGSSGQLWTPGSGSQGSGQSSSGVGRAGGRTPRS